MQNNGDVNKINNYNIIHQYENIIRSASTEIIVIISNLKVFNFCGSKLIDIILEEANFRKIMFKVIIPKDSYQQEIIETIKKSENIKLLFIKEIERSNAIIIIADGNVYYHIINDSINPPSLKFEKKQQKYGFNVVIVILFEILWNQSFLHEQVEKDEKMKEEFINICAHELRTPIHPILFLSDLLMGKLKDKDQRTILEMITSNAKRLNRFADDLLDVSRIESNSLLLNKEKFNLNDLVVDLVNYYNNNILIDAKNIENKKIFIKDEGVFYVNADKDRITQVISNILNNSIKFTKTGDILLSIEKADSNVRVKITDKGTGIDQDVLPKLFTKFTSKSNNGVGLGLYISKSIVEAHEGRIGAENNEKENLGCTFYFTLPLITYLQKIKNKKVLVIVNDLDFALALKALLEKDEYIIDIYTNSLIVEDHFMEGDYLLVVIDIGIEDMNGVDLAQKLKNRDKKVKICFLTTGKTNYRSLVKLYGIKDEDIFIRKTNDLKNIKKQIDEILAI